ncbi:hypothetical protein EV426DRAFT_674274 [Tirmania nivea]|nr:hypothetical protein EV426DRAFT_674274 [Tirmania nivea]
MRFLLGMRRKLLYSPIRLCKRSHSSVTTFPGSKSHAATAASKAARTRFAPSPTGQMHLGSLRTALFNYLYAEKTGGQFLLRIEDTDKKRTVEGAEQGIYGILRWAGLQWDEGPEVGGPHGPYRQSERTELHQKHAHMLVKSGHAYRCFCTPQRLQALAVQRARMNIPTDYDRTCVHISEAESDERAARGDLHVIRLKAPDDYPVFTDLLYGDIQYGSNKQAHNTGSYSDPIMLKSDGMPTYHLANVVDDHHMKITHVIRATEWMPSTPKHVYLYQAFGWALPAFVHVGLLQNEQKKKLSKRDGDVDVAVYRDKGYLPEALNNFVALLGSSHTRKDDVMAMQDLIEEFDLPRLTVGNTIVTFSKLDFLQKSHLRTALSLGSASSSISPTADPQPAPHPILATLLSLGKSLYPNLPEDYLSRCIHLNLHNLVLPGTYFDSMVYMFTPSVVPLYWQPPALKALKKINSHLASTTLAVPTTPTGTPTSDPATVQANGSLPDLLLPLLTDLARIPPTDWTLQRIQEVFPHHVDKVRDLPGFQRYIALMQFLRLAIAGGTHGPGIPETMEVLGREWVFLRFKEALGLFTLTEEDKSGGELCAVVRRAGGGEVLTREGGWAKSRSEAEQGSV